MIKAIVFDFDGVIHNSFLFHRDKISEFSGADLSEEELRTIHKGNFFDTMPEKIRNVDWVKYAEFIYEGQSHLEMEGAMKEFLTRLSRDYKLFVISSSHTRNIMDYFKNNGAVNLFTEILGMDLHRSKIEKFNFIFKKYNLDTNNSVFITDTLGDVMEANTLGIKTIGVDFGYHDKETLAKGNPMKIVSSLGELKEAIKEL